MNLSPIFRKIVTGAAEGSLDVAGSALLPGAWPIVKKALDPVLDRLKERLGGEEVTSSPKLAKKAAEAFEADQHLQEILRSKLLEGLEGLVKTQKEINSDVQKLMLIVTGDQNLLNDLVGGVGRIEQRLEKGVNLSDESIERLTKAVLKKAENSREVRGLALSEMGPVMQLLQDQVHRLQIRADELLREGQTDRAADEVQAGLMLVAALLQEAPTDLMLRLQMGFVYKTVAQVFDQAGDAAHREEYIGKADVIFNSVKDEIPGDAASAVAIGNAIHGQGNMAQARKDFVGAIEKYKLATSILPSQFYSWHDMFLCYLELAKAGQINLPEMRNALAKFKETGQGQPGLGAQYVAQLEAALRPYESGEQDAPSAAKKPAARSRTHRR